MIFALRAINQCIANYLMWNEHWCVLNWLINIEIFTTTTTRQYNNNGCWMNMETKDHRLFQFWSLTRCGTWMYGMIFFNVWISISKNVAYSLWCGQRLSQQTNSPRIYMVYLNEVFFHYVYDWQRFSSFLPRSYYSRTFLYYCLYAQIYNVH